MRNFLFRIIVKALVIYFLLPKIDNLTFRGDFLTAIFIAIFFSLMMWVVELCTVTFATILTISTLGLALLVLIPLWIFGFWFLPALALELVSSLFPQYLVINGLTPAVLGGLLLMLANLLTGSVSVMQRSLSIRK